MKDRRFTYAVAVAIAVVAAQPAAAVGTLLVDGSFNTPGDLTRVQIDGGPTILEFLDLSVTNGMTVAAAVSQYGVDGFRWADGSDIANLFSAFGMAYANGSAAVTTIASSQSQRAEFVSHLSQTIATGSLGWVDHLTTSTLHTYVCVGTSTCEGSTPPGGSFANNTDRFWPNTQGSGVFLVRTVPEPSSWLLMAGGIAALGACVRLRSRCLAGGGQ